MDFWYHKGSTSLEVLAEAVEKVGSVRVANMIREECCAGNTAVTGNVFKFLFMLFGESS